MEKTTPHCKLPVVNALIKEGRVRATGSAYIGARELGIVDLAGMCEFILALTPADFYKSMTTYADTAFGKTCTEPQLARVKRCT